MVYDVDNPGLNTANEQLKDVLSHVSKDKYVVAKARAKRIARVQLWNDSTSKTVNNYEHREQGHTDTCVDPDDITHCKIS